jgi:putative nucleotidyltransferase with HDIG domain
MNELLTRFRQPLLKRIIELLPKDTPVFLVGGAVRDVLLNRPNFDLDFVTSADAMKIARQVANDLGAAYFPLDTERHVARVILKSPDSIFGQKGTSPRVDFSSLQGEDLMSDLRGRDFTMNAMAVDIVHPQKLIDPLGGAADLLSKRLRSCSPSTFLDDPVRILRAIRFSVDLGLTIQSDTLQHIHQAITHLPEVSAERLRDELFRMLLQSHPSTSLRILDQLNALVYVLPELCLLKGVQQSPPHIMDVWDHTLDCISRIESILDVLAPEYDPEKSGNLAMGLVAMRLGRFRKPLLEHLNNALNPDRPHRGLLFLAGLYHDVGKHKTQTMDDSGKIRFINHEQVGGKLAEKRGQELKLSNLEIERMITIVDHHMRPSWLSHQDDLPTRKAIYRFFRDTGAAGVDICILSLADVLATYGPTLVQDRWMRHLDVVRVLLSAWWENPAEDLFPPPIIDGEKLMAELDILPGPIVGYLLESIREAQVTRNVQTQQEAIILARNLLQDDLNKKTGVSTKPV